MALLDVDGPRDFELLERRLFARFLGTVAFRSYHLVVLVILI